MRVKYDKHELGKLLKEARLNAGYTQSEVANIIGLTSPQFISNIERGTCVIPVEILQLLPKLYNICPRKLIEILIADFRTYLESSLSIHPDSKMTR